MADHLGSFPGPIPPRGPEPDRVTGTRRDENVAYSKPGGDPESEPVVVTEARHDFVGSHVVRSSVPFPEPEPDFTRSRTDNVSSAAFWKPSPERDKGEISESCQDDIAAWFGGGTPVRGEDTETKSRGELAYTEPVPESTGTFARGETDYDPRLLSLFDTASTFTHSGRGDSDQDNAALYDMSADDPADRRRITPLGVIAARQDAALDR